MHGIVQRSPFSSSGILSPKAASYYTIDTSQTFRDYVNSCPAVQEGYDSINEQVSDRRSPVLSSGHGIQYRFKNKEVYA